jgi:hypothetical protein
MKRILKNLGLMKRVGLLFIILLLPILTHAQLSEVLDNAKVISLINAGLGESILLSKIRSSKVMLDASERALVELKNAGASDAVIVALIERSAAFGSMSNGPRDGYVELPSGTELKVITKEKLSGKKLSVGQRINLEVAENLVLAGKVVVFRGVLVTATVSDARKPGMMGRSGRLSFVFESTTGVDGQTIKLRGAKSGKDGDSFGATYTMVAIFGAPGLLKHGRNSSVKPGTVFTAYTDESKFIKAF